MKDNLRGGVPMVIVVFRGSTGHGFFCTEGFGQNVKTGPSEKKQISRGS